MSNSNNIEKNLFNSNGCLEPNTFELILNKTLSKKEHKLIQSHLEECSFCQDAYDGFSITKTKNILANTESLKQRLINKHIGEKNSNKKLMWKERWIIIPSAAAIFIIFLSFFFLLHSYKDNITFNVSEQRNESSQEIYPKKIEKNKTQEDKEKVMEKSNFPFESEEKIPEKKEDKVKTKEENTIKGDNVILDESISTLEMIDSDEIGFTSEEEDGDLQLDAEAFFEEDKEMSDTFAMVVNSASNKPKKNILEPIMLARKGKSKSQVAETSYKSDFNFFTTVEVMPEFPEGEDALQKFLYNELQYPAEALVNGIEGIVQVSFVVNKSGEISNIKVIKGIGSGCDEEAIRVVKLMPNWKPGMHHDQFVNVEYVLPIHFKLK